MHLFACNVFQLEDAKRDAQQALDVAEAAKDDRLIALAQLVSGQIAQQRIDNTALGSKSSPTGEAEASLCWRTTRQGITSFCAFG